MNNKIIIGLVALIVLLLAIFGLTKGFGNRGGIAVETDKAATRTIVEVVSASGKIYPENDVKISPEVSGEVVELFVKEGDSVRAGQLLARIKADQYQPAVERSQASVGSAKAAVAAAQAQIGQLQAQQGQLEAQLDNARSVAKRQEQLFKDGVIAQAELDQARTALRSAEASLNAIKAQITASRENVGVSEQNVRGATATVREAQTNISKTQIHAPVSGVISKLNVKRGERVLGTQMMSGTEMMRISNFTAMEVQVDVSESDILRVAVGNPVDIEVDAYLNKKFTGKVTEIAASAKESAMAAAGNNDQMSNYVVKIRIDADSYREMMLTNKNKRSPFMPGMSATVDIRTNSVPNTLSIPVQAVTTREEESDAATKPTNDRESVATDTRVKEAKKKIQEIVFVAVGDTVARRVVTTGIQDNTHIQILSGLQAGDEVVTGPYSVVSRRLDSGDKIDREKLKKEKEERKKKAKEEN
jgi:HlyD family secretion protein